MNFKKYFEQQNIQLTDKEKVTVKVSGLITAARLYSNLSQKQLAEKIGTQQPSVARAEKGEMIASVEFLDKIARAIGTELVLHFKFMESYTKTNTVNIPVDISKISPYTHSATYSSSTNVRSINFQH